MKKLVGLKRAPRRRWAVAMVTGTVFVIAGIVGLAVPAFANHVGDMTANCNEVVVTFVDFPSTSTPVHIAIQVESVGSTSADVSVNDSTPPKHVNIANLTSQLNGQSANVVVDVTWVLDTNHHEHGSFPVTCGTHPTSTTASPATTSQTTATSTSTSTSTSTTVPVTVTTGGQQGSTSTSVPSPTVSVSGETTSTVIQTSPETASLPPGTSAVSAGGASLPFTGGSSLPLLLVGLALLIGGAAAVLAPRRRSSES
jgi:hypothetical protein